MDKQTKFWTEVLQKRADLYAQEGMKGYDALELAAGEFNLKLVAADNACRIYQTPDGQLVNCWVG